LKTASFPTAAMTFLGKFFILLPLANHAPNRRQKFGNDKPSTKPKPPQTSIGET
jgi:hypothetical protein